MNCNHTTENEISLFNQYLLSVWAVVGSVVGVAQIIEGGHDVFFYLGFLVCAAVPFGICLLLQFRPAGKVWVPTVGTVGFLLLYGYICLTASNELVSFHFCFCFPCIETGDCFGFPQRPLF